MRLAKSIWAAAALFAAIGFAGAPAAAQGEAASIWADLAQSDLAAIRDLLADNHPGPVDPENGRYAEWLQEGYAEASRRAAAATSMAEYERALRYFVNGFRDGHIALNLSYQPRVYSWPRFLAARSPDGEADTVFHSRIDAIPEGANLRSCDGQTIDTLLADRIDPYYFNADIPHTRSRNVPRLFTLDPGDEDRQFARCTFAIGGETRTIDLEWSLVSMRTRSELFAALRSDRPELGLAERDAMVFIGLPSFVQTGSGAVAMQALIDEIAVQRETLRDRTVIFDVRGNGGGNSAWGVAVAQALWGEEWVGRITESFDNTVDWRVSPSNVAHLDGIFETVSRDGLDEAADYVDSVRTAMAAALERGDTLVRVPEPGVQPSDPPPPSPISGRVYFLTDSRCGSACLDFADLMRRLPGVTHIGLPTYADAIYIDNTVAALPSGLARFSYSLKVYRNRVRANNEFYTPEILWPGGPMTDDAITTWVGALNSGAALER